MSVIPLPINRATKPRPAKPEPDAVRLHTDFGSWCVEFFKGDQFVTRHLCVDEAAADAEIDRLVGEGLRRLEPGPYLQGKHDYDLGEGGE